jgi:hypothetical protein
LRMFVLSGTAVSLMSRIFIRGERRGRRNGVRLRR